MNIYLRPVVTEDIDLLFEWANEKSVRHNSFHQNVISYREHEKWFSDILNSDNCIIYILCIDDISIGQIRIDIDGVKGIINYSIDSRYRGKGFGTLILSMAIKKIVNIDNNVFELIGRVKKDNIISCKAFERAGFIGYIRAGFIEYIRNVSKEI